MEVFCREKPGRFLGKKIPWKIKIDSPEDDGEYYEREREREREQELCQVRRFSEIFFKKTAVFSPVLTITL
jgi:hypothetical protein